MLCQNCSEKEREIFCFCSSIVLCLDCFKIHKEALPTSQSIVHTFKNISKNQNQLLQESLRRRQIIEDSSITSSFYKIPSTTDLHGQKIQPNLQKEDHNHIRNGKQSLDFSQVIKQQSQNIENVSSGYYSFDKHQPSITGNIEQQSKLQQQPSFTLDRKRIQLNKIKSKILKAQKYYTQIVQRKLTEFEVKISSIQQEIKKVNQQDFSQQKIYWQSEISDLSKVFSSFKIDIQYKGPIVSIIYIPENERVRRFSVLEQLQVQPIPIPIEGVSKNYKMVATNQGLFCSGGLIQTRPTDAFAEFEFKSNKWDKRIPMKKARHSHASVIFNNAIFVIGGIGIQIQKLNSTEYYQLQKPYLWKQGPNLIKPRSSPSATVFGGKLYVCGGSNSSQIEVLESAENEFEMICIQECINFEKVLIFGVENQLILLNIQKYYVMNTDHQISQAFPLKNSPQLIFPQNPFVLGKAVYLLGEENKMYLYFGGYFEEIIFN